MAQFGLNGYQVELTATDGGYHLSVYSQEFPELTAETDVKRGDLPYPELPINDRAQTEALCKPLFDSLDKKVEEARAKNAHAAADADKIKRLQLRSASTRPSAPMRTPQLVRQPKTALSVPQ